LIGLTRTLSPGEKATLILIFEKAGEITIESEVRAP
jgi:copper(I)-binding protein